MLDTITEIEIRSPRLQKRPLSDHAHKNSSFITINATPSQIARGIHNNLQLLYVLLLEFILYSLAPKQGQ